MRVIMEGLFLLDTLVYFFVNVLLIVNPDTNDQGLSDMRLEFKKHLGTVLQAILVTSETVVLKLQNTV